MRPTCEGLLITGPSCRRLDTDEVEGRDSLKVRAGRARRGRGLSLGGSPGGDQGRGRRRGLVEGRGRGEGGDGEGDDQEGDSGG